ncbi:MAG: alpha/beta fold hydrolase [Actinomycetales bacterium]
MDILSEGSLLHSAHGRDRARGRAHLDEKPRPVVVDTGEVVLRGDHYAGPGPDARHIVLVHGGGQTRHSWRSTAADLAAAGYAATTVDLRGHGDSSWSLRADYSLSSFRSDIAQLVRQVGAPATLVGASLGGLTALSVAAHHPELTSGLVLVDIVPRTVPEGAARIRDFMSRHTGGFDSLDEVATVIADYKQQPRRYNPDGLLRVVRLRDDGRWYWHWDPRVVDSRHDDAHPGSAADALMRVAARVTAPTVVVRGEASDVVDDDGVAALLQAIPGSTSVDVADAGHMIAGDANDAFTEAVARFLAGLGR